MNFVELREREVQHSPGPDGTGGQLQPTANAWRTVESSNETRGYFRSLIP